MFIYVIARVAPRQRQARPWGRRRVKTKSQAEHGNGWRHRQNVALELIASKCGVAELEMIITDCFQGDTNKALKKVQHDLYVRENAFIDLQGKAYSSIHYLYTSAVRALMFNTEGSNPMFFPEQDQITSIDTFDHRCLQDAHDIIAAFYRWIHRYTAPPVFASSPKDYKAYLLAQWKNYFTTEVTMITWQRLDVAELTIRAVLHSSLEGYSPDYDSEESLTEFLHARYGSEFCSALAWHRKKLHE